MLNVAGGIVLAIIILSFLPLIMELVAFMGKFLLFLLGGLVIILLLHNCMDGGYQYNTQPIHEYPSNPLSQYHGVLR